jgi:hypothetical protein
MLHEEGSLVYGYLLCLKLCPWKIYSKIFSQHVLAELHFAYDS